MADGNVTLEMHADDYNLFAQACAACASVADFEAVVRKRLRPMLPHGMLIAAIGRLDMDQIEISDLVGVDFPAAALAEISPIRNLRDRPVVARWLKTRQPVVVQLPDDDALVSDMERGEIQQLGLGRLAIHGMIDILARGATYFSFARVPPEISTRSIRHVLTLTVPMLHHALVAAVSSKPVRPASAAGPKLTRCEIEVLRWVAAGRTNSEIAVLRGKGLSTIRNQLHSAFAKLGVSSRAEASRAMLSKPRTMDGLGF